MMPYAVFLLLVFTSVPIGAMDWSEVCNCGTSSSYSLTLKGPFHQNFVLTA